MNTVEILTKARDLIANPYAWTKGDYESVRVRGAKQFNCYCAVGALRRATRSDFQVGDYDLVNKACEVIAQDRKVKRMSESTPTGKVIEYNDKDSTTKKDIIALFNRAIKRAAKEQS